MLAGLMTVAMAAATGGRASPYYGGINLVLLGTTLLLSGPPFWSRSSCIRSPRPGVVSHSFFLLGTTSAFAFASTIAGTRWREFTMRGALAGRRWSTSGTFWRA
jgi:hypothetical protein